MRQRPTKTAPDDREFKAPPGFKTKKRGELVLYCMRDSTVGTRFKTEKCYNETQMREYLLALEVQKRDIDRIRSTCATGSTCAPHSPDGTWPCCPQPEPRGARRDGQGLAIGNETVDGTRGRQG